MVETKQSEQLLDNPARRNLMLGAAATAVLTAGPAMAMSEHKHDHKHSGASSLVESALDCVKAGDLCAAHCIDLIKAGDTSIAQCLATVSDMLPMCTALARLGAADSPHLKALARVCIAVCEDCEKECRKHADKHEACKACAEACADCIEECRKLVA